MVGIAYQAKLVDGSRPSPGTEMLEVGVFPPDALPPLAFPSHHQVLAEYSAALLTSLPKVGVAGPGIGVAKAPRGRRPSRAQAPSRPRRRP